LIVHINPIDRPETPKTATDIIDRINEISFNSSLLSEMRAIAFVKKLLEHNMLKEEYKADFKDILVHSVRADDALSGLPMTSKFNSDWEFLLSLRDKGRDAMTAWLADHFDDLGKRDSVDLHEAFLNSNTKIFHDRHGKQRHNES
jgi:NTE family protein